MAVLARCWLITEYILIPYGLSFYINPIFLFFFQIFLWIKQLQRWLSLFLFPPAFYLFSCILKILRRFAIISRLFAARFNDTTTAEAGEEDIWFEVSDSFSSPNTKAGLLFLQHHEVSSYAISNICSEVDPADFKVGPVETFDQETISLCSSSDISDEDMCLEQCSSPVCGSSSQDTSFPSSSHSELEVNLYSSLPLTEESQMIEQRKEKETDPFYKIYAERMSWFDLLNQERTLGISAFLNKKQYLGCEKRILKSLESDFEVVYVAQSCLSWEALHHQYKKLEAIIARAAETTCTYPYGVLCSSTTAAKFQKFLIVIERFMEDERCDEGKRYLKFVQKRSSLKSLLQVPDISENMDGQKEGKEEEMMIRATDVLRTIEKCIKAFWLFVKVDKKEPWWRARNLLWTRSPLEDPRDFKLLYDLTHTLRKKEIWMKDLKGKKRCCLRKSRMDPYGDQSQKKEMMFAMIELKLVSRVLMMSMISTSQLQWCQQKLRNIEFSQGKIIRPYKESSLFPPS